MAERGIAVRKTGLPMGIEDFEEIRKEQLYYVDKTGIIKNLLENMGKVSLNIFLKLDVTTHFLTDWKLRRKKSFATDLWESFL